MRIVAGRLRGRALIAPKGHATRPTSDRVRGAIFNMLAHGSDDFAIEGLRVLDLFAGSGAMGIEALSRGAASCLFVESNAPARTALGRNIEDLGLASVAVIAVLDATRLGRPPAAAPFQLVFADPPYGRGLAEKALASAAHHAWLSTDALVVIEERADAGIMLPAAFQTLQARRWGDTQAVFARYRGQ